MKTWIFLFLMVCGVYSECDFGDLPTNDQDFLSKPNDLEIVEYTRIKGIDVTKGGSGVNYVKFEPNSENTKYILSLTNMAEYVNEQASSENTIYMNPELTFSCNDGSQTPRKITYNIKLIPVNDNSPIFIDKNGDKITNYAIILPMPFPPGIAINLLHEDIRVKDIDIYNTGIEFSNPENLVEFKDYGKDKKGKIFTVNVFPIVSFTKPTIITLKAKDKTFEMGDEEAKEATLTIRIEKNEETSVISFNKNFFAGSFNAETKSVVLDPISVGSNEINDFGLKDHDDSDKYSKCFEAEKQSNAEIKIKYKECVEKLSEEKSIELILMAKSGDKIVAETTVIFQILTKYFKNAVYEGQFEKGKPLTMQEEIRLENAFGTIPLESDPNTLQCAHKVPDIVECTLDEMKEAVEIFQLTASNDNGETVTQVVIKNVEIQSQVEFNNYELVHEIKSDELPWSKLQLKAHIGADSAGFTYEIDKESGTPEQITIKPDDGKITVNKGLPPSLYEFNVLATKEDKTGIATVVIIVEENIITFDTNYLTGTFDVENLKLNDDLPSIESDNDKNHLALSGDFSDCFEPVKKTENLKEIQIKYKETCPSLPLDKKSIELTLTASLENYVKAKAIIVFEIITKYFKESVYQGKFDENGIHLKDIQLINANIDLVKLTCDPDTLKCTDPTKEGLITCTLEEMTNLVDTFKLTASNKKTDSETSTQIVIENLKEPSAGDKEVEFDTYKLVHQLEASDLPWSKLQLKAHIADEYDGFKYTILPGQIPAQISIGEADGKITVKPDIPADLYNFDVIASKDGIEGKTSVVILVKTDILDKPITFDKHYLSGTFDLENLKLNDDLPPITVINPVDNIDLTLTGEFSDCFEKVKNPDNPDEIQIKFKSCTRLPFDKKSIELVLTATLVEVVDTANIIFEIITKHFEKSVYQGKFDENGLELKDVKLMNANDQVQLKSEPNTLACTPPTNGEAIACTLADITNLVETFTLTAYNEDGSETSTQIVIENLKESSGGDEDVLFDSYDLVHEIKVEELPWSELQLKAHIGDDYVGFVYGISTGGLPTQITIDKDGKLHVEEGVPAELYNFDVIASKDGHEGKTSVVILVKTNTLDKPITFDKHYLSGTFDVENLKLNDDLLPITVINPVDNIELTLTGEFSDCFEKVKNPNNPDEIQIKFKSCTRLPFDKKSIELVLTATLVEVVDSVNIVFEIITKHFGKNVYQGKFDENGLELKDVKLMKANDQVQLKSEPNTLACTPPTNEEAIACTLADITNLVETFTLTAYNEDGSETSTQIVIENLKESSGGDEEVAFDTYKLVHQLDASDLPWSDLQLKAHIGDEYDGFKYTILPGQIPAQISIGEDDGKLTVESDIPADLYKFDVTASKDGIEGKTSVVILVNTDIPDKPITFDKTYINGYFDVENPKLNEDLPKITIQNPDNNIALLLTGDFSDCFKPEKTGENQDIIEIKYNQECEKLPFEEKSIALTLTAKLGDKGDEATIVLEIITKLFEKNIYQGTLEDNVFDLEQIKLENANDQVGVKTEPSGTLHCTPTGELIQCTLDGMTNTVETFELIAYNEGGSETSTHIVIEHIKEPVGDEDIIEFNDYQLASEIDLDELPWARLEVRAHIGDDHDGFTYEIRTPGKSKHITVGVESGIIRVTPGIEEGLHKFEVTAIKGAIEGIADVVIVITCQTKVNFGKAIYEFERFTHELPFSLSLDATSNDIRDDIEYSFEIDVDPKITLSKTGEFKAEAGLEPKLYAIAVIAKGSETNVQDHASVILNVKERVILPDEFYFDTYERTHKISEDDLPIEDFITLTAHIMGQEATFTYTLEPVAVGLTINPTTGKINLDDGILPGFYPIEVIAKIVDEEKGRTPVFIIIEKTLPEPSKVVFEDYLPAYSVFTDELPTQINFVAKEGENKITYELKDPNVPNIGLIEDTGGLLIRVGTPSKVYAISILAKSASGNEGVATFLVILKIRPVTPPGEINFDKYGTKLVDTLPTNLPEIVARSDDPKDVFNYELVIVPNTYEIYLTGSNVGQIYVRETLAPGTYVITVYATSENHPDKKKGEMQFALIYKPTGVVEKIIFEKYTISYKKYDDQFPWNHLVQIIPKSNVPYDFKFGIEPKIKEISVNEYGVVKIEAGLALGIHDFSVVATNTHTYYHANAPIALFIEPRPKLEAQYSHLIVEIQEEDVDRPVLETNDEHSGFCIVDQYPDPGHVAFEARSGNIYSKQLNREDKIFEQLNMQLPQYTLTVKLTKTGDLRDNWKCPEYTRKTAFKDDVSGGINMYQSTLTSQDTTTISVLIGDINDNIPEFAEENIFVCYPKKEILDSIQPPYLAKVHATDKDAISSGYGVITYVVLEDSEFITVDPTNGEVYPTSSMYDKEELVFTVRACDNKCESNDNYKGMTITVKVVGAEHLITMSTTDKRVDQIDDYLKTLSPDQDITIKALSIGAIYENVGTVVRNRFNRTKVNKAESKLSLDVIIYGIQKNGDVLLATEMQTLLSGQSLELGPVDVSDVPPTDNSESTTTDTTGLIAAVAVLAALLVIILVGGFVFWYRKLRNRSIPYSISENNTSGSSPGNSMKGSTPSPGLLKKTAPLPPIDNLDSASRKSEDKHVEFLKQPHRDSDTGLPKKIERRNTGYVFNAPKYSDDEEEKVDGKFSDSKILDLDFEKSDNTLDTGKSVTFNNNVIRGELFEDEPSDKLQV